MSIFGGTISPFVVERDEYGMNVLREPTAEELAKMEAERAEHLRKNAEWEAGRPERERLAAERNAKWERDQRAHLDECDATFPVAGIAGEYDDYGHGMFLEAWPSNTGYLWPLKIKFVTDKCNFCGESTQVLEVANAADEYSYLCACRSCLDKIFDAFEAKVLTQ